MTSSRGEKQYHSMDTQFKRTISDNSDYNSTPRALSICLCLRGAKIKIAKIYRIGVFRWT